MKRDYKLYLKDIEESIKHIENYMNGVSEKEFKENTQLQDAVVRRFEIIGEASRNIPRALKERNKHVPWFEMSQFRDLMAHSYFNVGTNKIWLAFSQELPNIKESLKNIKLV